MTVAGVGTGVGVAVARTLGVVVKVDVLATPGAKPAAGPASVNVTIIANARPVPAKNLRVFMDVLP
jgi:hypothetical protein